MNPVPVHLMLNHLPLFGTLIASLLLFYALIARKEEVRKAALGILILLALASPVVYFSGENSEDWAEEAGLSHDAIEEHEDAAKWAFILLIAQGVLAAGALALHGFPNTGKLRVRVAWAAAILSLGVFASAARTSNTGGLIRHGEEMGAPKDSGPSGH